MKSLRRSCYRNLGSSETSDVEAKRTPVEIAGFPFLFSLLTYRPLAVRNSASSVETYILLRHILDYREASH